MATFYSPIHQRFSFAGMSIDGLNSDRILTNYSNPASLPITIRAHIQPHTTPRGTAIYMDTENARTFTLLDDSANTITPQSVKQATGTFRGTHREYALLEIGHTHTTDYIDIRITGKSQGLSGDPLVIHKIYVLHILTNYLPDLTFDLQDMSENDVGRTEYTSLYNRASVVASGNYAKRDVRWRATQQNESGVRNLYDIFNNYPHFMFEENFDETPEHVYEARFIGNIQETYTYQYKPSGKSLTFRIAER